MNKNQIETNVKAGNLDLSFDNGALRYIRLNNIEIIRNIYFALRNQNWETVPFRIENLIQQIDKNSFSLRFKAIHYENSTDVFEWNVEIKGSETNEITFKIDGQALQEFWRNRAGFCVLHPIEECKGRLVEIIEPYGKKSIQKFPQFIAPNRPFPYIQKMVWVLERNTDVFLDFEGDNFETEDQRNWTDSSYKTFCTPLSKPFPVLLQKGEKVSQKVTLKVNIPNTFVNVHEDIITITLLDRTVPFPKIGTQQSFEKEGFLENEINVLRELQLDHYRVEIDFENEHWQQQIILGQNEALSIGTALFLALTFTTKASQEIECISIKATVD